MEKTFLAVGVACILAAIVGGGFKGLGVEIPVIETRRRQIMLATAGVLLISIQQYFQWTDRRDSADPAALVASGLEAYDSGDFPNAAEQLKSAAKHGSAEAEYHYGEMLYHGEGVVPDKSAASEWILKSASKGFPPAEASAAMLAWQQVPPDTTSAHMWAERSANQNDPVGLYTLAALETDPSKSRALFLRSAELGYAPSQLIVAVKSMPTRPTGKGSLLMRLLDGLEWTKRAAYQGDQSAQLLMANYNFTTRNRDSLSLATAYVWWILAQKPHPPVFQASPQVVSATHALGDSIEARLPIPMQIEARRQAAEEPGWQPKPERLYRHGH